MKLIVLAMLPVLAFGRQSSAPASSPKDAPAATEAPKIDPALLADIRRLLDISGAAKLMEQQFDAALAPAIDMLKRTPNLKPEFADEFQKRIRERLLESGKIQETVTEEYATHFTRDEIRQMIAYQESPVGRKAARVMPEMMGNIIPKMRQYGQTLGAGLAQEIMAEHPDYVIKKEPDAGDTEKK
jgi:hypothetical protein